MKKFFYIVFLVLAVGGCVHTRADRKVPVTAFANEFWRNLVWQRYGALTGFVAGDHKKDLKKWLGPKQEPGIRILESRLDEMHMAGALTAEVSYVIRYFVEPEYLEKVTTVTQRWERDGQVWRLIGGYPLEDLEKVQKP